MSVSHAETARNAVIECSPAGVEEDIINFIADIAATICEDEVQPGSLRLQLEEQVAPYFEDIASAKDVAALCDSVVSAVFPASSSELTTGGAEELDLVANGDILCHVPDLILMYGGSPEPLLKNTSLCLMRGHRYGVLGSNGSGKTTLMAALMARFAGQQGLSGEALRVLHFRHEALLQGVGQTTTAKEYVQLRARGSDAASEQAIAQSLLDVGFGDEALHKTVRALSGGWQMRLALACAVAQKTNILLLDEPTNHLDAAGVRWLADFINMNLVDGATVIVSHEADFLDKVCTDIVHLSNHKLSYHPGNYTAFKATVLRDDDAKAQTLLETTSQHDECMAFPKPELRFRKGMVDVTFQPGGMGVGINTANGLVESIEEGGQAELGGIVPGFVMKEIDGIPYSDGLLRKTRKAAREYTVSFGMSVDVEADLSEIAATLIGTWVQIERGSVSIAADGDTFIINDPADSKPYRIKAAKFWKKGHLHYGKHTGGLEGQTIAWSNGTVWSKLQVTLKNASFQYAGADGPVWSDVDVQLTTSSRVAIVGENGCGKSTLLAVLTRSLQSSGELWCQEGLRLAHVAQHSVHHLEKCFSSTPLEYLQLRFRGGYDAETPKAKLSDEVERRMQDLGAKHGKCGKAVEALLSRIKEDVGRQSTYRYEVKWRDLGSIDNTLLDVGQLNVLGAEDLIAEFENLLWECWGAGEARPLTTHEVVQHLKPFGFSEDMTRNRKISMLSAGEKCKLVFAAAFWVCPHILCLDEPTNYLDMGTVALLQRSIRNFRGACVVVTHNERFVEQVCNEVWEIAAGHVKVRKQCRETQ